MITLVRTTRFMLAILAFLLLRRQVERKKTIGTRQQTGRRGIGKMIIQATLKVDKVVIDNRHII